MNSDEKYYLKVIIIGDPAVGKTSLVIRYVSNRFNKDYRSTIGTNIYSKEILLANNQKVFLNLWDIAGQERWAKMREKYYYGSKGAIVVGDLTRPKTFEQIKDFWIQDIKKYLSEIPIILIGNKNDLESKVSLKTVEKLGNEINSIGEIITSAKTGENVEEAFKKLSEEIITINKK
ncbi:MAG: GTP-binding protein [Promethearchaeati archaeon]